MPTKYTREGFRERTQALGKFQYRIFGGGGGKPTQIGPMRKRRLFMYAVPAMVLLVLAGHLVKPAIDRRVEPVREKEAAIFAKQSFDEGTPEQEYLLGVRLTLDDGRTFEDVVKVDAAFWRQMKEGDTVTVRYKRDPNTGAVEIRKVFIPEATP